MHVKPVIQVYKKMASCSSSMTCLELEDSWETSSSMSLQKMCFWMPSSLQMQSGWPLRSSWTHILPVRRKVWYGMGSVCMVEDGTVSAMNLKTFNSSSPICWFWIRAMWKRWSEMSSSISVSSLDLSAVCCESLDILCCCYQHWSIWCSS